MQEITLRSFQPGRPFVGWQLGTIGISESCMGSKHTYHTMHYPWIRLAATYSSYSVWL